MINISDESSFNLTFDLTSQVAGPSIIRVNGLFKLPNNQSKILISGDTVKYLKQCRQDDWCEVTAAGYLESDELSVTFNLNGGSIMIYSLVVEVMKEQECYSVY